ncbi:MFS general substrate transporter [Rhizodiscina lignyota]|uniref:MFS general substrate transporter n=1 Tax=Rhizodiscina lignyota TaxID=1504668 RepID=A0A9P4MC33_9PEZI|nr:MFS general substrate transporter [Rhizodiscina lignyota]
MAKMRLLGSWMGVQAEGRGKQTSTDDLEAKKQRPPKWSLGILNDKETDEVPGSILLMSKVAERNEPLGLQHVQARTSSSSLPSPFPQLSRRSSQTSTYRVKQEKKKTPDGKIILEPQPDESPNDPLNWPAFRRDLALLSLGLYCMVGGGMTPILAAGFSNVASTYHISTARVSLTTGLYMMGLGIGSVVASPTAILFGKRPVYLVGSILFILSAVWCALSPNFPSLIVARIFQGIAVSPVECLPSATVAEIFFLHERAYRLGIYTLLLLGGKNLVPLVSAAIINSLGWRWVFWMVAIVVGLCGALLFLFVPETFWDRTPRPRRVVVRDPNDANVPESDVPIHSPIIPSPMSEPVTEQVASPPEPRSGFHSPVPQHIPPSPMDYTTYHRDAPPKTWTQTLRPYAGRLSKDNWFKVALRPFILFAYPSILWSAMVYSFSVGWLIVLSESVTVIYRSRDTYNFTALQAGLVYISPFIGGVLGTAVAGKVSDIIVRAMSRRNEGVYEPEFRLVMAIPITLACTGGLWMFGWSAQNKDSWIVPTLGFGLTSFGCSLGSTTAITFAVDCYRGYAGEALVTLNFSKNIFHGLVFSLFFTNWLESDGSKEVFLIVGGIQLACMLFTIPMYIYGKRCRMWTVRKNLMEKF